MDVQNKTVSELVEMMRDKVQELADANGQDISVKDACDKITEAILIGALIVGSVTEEPISIVLGQMAGVALERELVSEFEAAQRQADIARFN